MSTEFIRCEFCKGDIPLELCKIAAVSRVIDGKKYTFCCEVCAQRYQRTKK